MVNKKKELDKLIIIQTNEVEKTKKLLDKEHISYKIYNSETSHKSKVSPKRKNIEEVVKAFDRASIKY